MNETKELSRFITQVQYEDLSVEVINKTKELVLDQLGVQLAGSTHPWSRGVYRYVRDLAGRSESCIVNFGDRVPAENAAFVNGTFGHSFEIDDTDLAILTHPGTVIVPATLAMGEKELVNGKSFILSIVLGCEVMGRIGRAVQPSMTKRGHHATCALGTFGAAAAAGRILGFDEEKIMDALSIAGSHSAGLRGYTGGGGSVKRLHPGMAAQGGIRSALLVINGITGPPNVLEGENGFCQAFSDTPQIEKITANLGRPFIITEVAYKLYACCIQIHSSLDALSSIMKQNPIDTEEIKEIGVGLSEFGFHAVGSNREPRDITGFQFSAPFSLALRLIKGSNGLTDYTEENLLNPEIKAIAGRVRVEVDKEMTSLFPSKIGARLTVKLKNGKSYQEKVYDAGGTPAHPASAKELQDKFRDLSSTVLPADRSNKIIEVVYDLENIKEISTLACLLRQ